MFQQSDVSSVYLQFTVSAYMQFNLQNTQNHVFLLDFHKGHC